MVIKGRKRFRDISISGRLALSIIKMNLRYPLVLIPVALTALDETDSFNLIMHSKTDLMLVLE